MSSKETTIRDYQGFSSNKKDDSGNLSAFSSLKSPKKNTAEIPQTLSAQGFNPNSENKEKVSEFFEPTKKMPVKENKFQAEEANVSSNQTQKLQEIKSPPNYADQVKQAKNDKEIAKDQKLLSKDGWLAKNGHTLSFAGLFLFTFWLYFRPYELLGMDSLKTFALYIALGTIFIFIPTQFTTEGNITATPPEIIYIGLLTLFAIVSVPIGRDPAESWAVFNDVFIKVVLMFIVMVNVVRTEFRLRTMLWLSLGIGAYLSYNAFDLYQRGVFKTEGYRVSVDVGGMFGNPNELATHFVMFIPVAAALAISAKTTVMKLSYFVVILLFLAGIMVTFSRGAFLGLIICSFVLAWKLGRDRKILVLSISAISSVIFLAAAPGGYGLRVLSILIPGLDPVGSADQRKELLIRSIWVTLRNPQGVGMGLFKIMNDTGHETHNAYTQVSSELGILALVVYLLLLISPINRLGAIEREMYRNKDFSWIYYLAIGLQVSIIAYMISSFFGSFAYNWFVYYPIAYAVALRRIYAIQQEKKAANEIGFESNLKTRPT
jgi:putative inorganic carbon (hco3(-)) transporter